MPFDEDLVLSSDRKTLGGCFEMLPATGLARVSMKYLFLMPVTYLLSFYFRHKGLRIVIAKKSSVLIVENSLVKRFHLILVMFHVQQLLE